MNVAAINHMGNLRTNNEDNFYLNGIYIPRKHFNNNESCLKNNQSAQGYFAVCDGMGGISAGEEAAFLTVSHLKKLLKPINASNIAKDFNQVFQTCSNKIYQYAQQTQQDAGTTIAMVALNNGKFQSYNVGDSRVYYYHNRALQCLSEDHSLVQRMISMGALQAEEAKTYPNAM